MNTSTLESTSTVEAYGRARRWPSRRARRWLAAALVAACASGAARPSRAGDDARNVQLAQALFDEAKRLMAENDFASACPKLAESQRLDPSGGTILHLGICHASEGKTASAYAELNEALSLARRDSRADRESVAKAHLAAVTPKLVRLTVTVDADARVPGLEVTWNGTPLPQAQWGVAFPVDPGEQVIAASAPGRRKWSTRVDASRAAASVAIPALPREGAEPSGALTPAAPPGPPGREEPTSPRSPGSTRRVLGVTLGVTGLVALGVAGVFQLRAISLAGERDDAAAAGDAEATASKHDSAKSSETAAFVAGGLGLVALGAGAVLFLTAPKGGSNAGASAKQPRVATSPWMSPAGGGLVLGGRF